MNVIKFLLRNSKGFVVLIVLIGTVGGLCNAGLIALIHAALTDSDLSALTLAWAFAGVCVLTLLSNITAQLLLLRLSQGSILELRLRLSQQILKTPLRRIEEVGPARLLTALSGDAGTLAQALFSVPLLCINIATLAACMIYIGLLSKFLLVGLIIYMVLGIASYHLPIRRALGYIKQARREMEKLFTHFRALTDGNKELKLHRARRDEFFSEDLKASAITLQHHTVRGMSIHIVAESWGRLLYFVFIGLLLFVLPLFSPMSKQDMTGYILIVLFLMGPVSSLLGLLPNFTQAQVALNRLEELGLSLLSDKPETEVPTAEVEEPEWHSLELRGATHSYHHEKDNSTFTLGPIDATFSPGELVFLIGGNGSGKSTLAKLLTGLYMPEAGEIRLDGRAVTDENRDNYRQLFTAIFSDFYLFHRLPGSTTSYLDEQARDYLVQFQLDQKVQVKNGMLDTPGLSSGQRKRLALLLAYMENRSFYLFDEWAADQDPIFKHIFYTQLLPELKARGKTILVISHDDKYYYVADRIIKLEYGQCVSYQKDEQQDGRLAYQL